MVTGPDNVGSSEEGMSKQDKLRADMLEDLIEEKLSGQEKGKNLYKFFVSNLEKIQDNILKIVENRYRTVWEDARITEESRSYQDTPGRDPYVYTVRLVKSKNDQEVIEILEKEIDEKLKAEGAGKDEYRIKLMPFPRKINQNVIRAIEELYEKNKGKWGAKMTQDEAEESQYASAYTLVLTTKK